MSNMYDIDEYTDKDCFHILSLAEKTTAKSMDEVDDAQLEQCILQHKSKYSESQSQKGKQLYHFFTAMYARFFEVEEEEEEEDNTSDAGTTTSSQGTRESFKPYRQQLHEGFSNMDAEYEDEDYFEINGERHTFQSRQGAQGTSGTTAENNLYRAQNDNNDVNFINRSQSTPTDYQIESGNVNNYDLLGRSVLRDRNNDGKIDEDDEDSNNSYDDDDDVAYFLNDSDADVVMEEDDKGNQKEKKYKAAMASNVVKDIEYVPGELNPILKDTIKRTITINSRDRDPVFKKTQADLTTDFHCYLEESLKNVVSIKLYAVQIPVTWYTIDSAYGSNIFYIKGSSPGINTSEHEYKIEIPPGNYTPTTIIDEINSKLPALKDNQNNNHNVRFYDLSCSYNTSNVKTTFTVDMEKVYNNKEFQVTFNNPTNSDKYNSLAKFLGYSDPEESNDNNTFDLSVNDFTIDLSYDFTGIVDFSYTIIKYSAPIQYDEDLPTNRIFTIDEFQTDNLPGNEITELGSFTFTASATTPFNGYYADTIRNKINILTNFAQNMKQNIKTILELSGSVISYTDLTGNTGASDMSNVQLNIKLNHDSKNYWSYRNQRFAIRAENEETKNILGIDASFSHIDISPQYYVTAIYSPVEEPTVDASNSNVPIVKLINKHLHTDITKDTTIPTIDFDIGVINPSDYSKTISEALTDICNNFNDNIQDLTELSGTTLSIINQNNNTKIQQIEIDISIGTTVDASDFLDVDSGIIQDIPIIGNYFHGVFNGVKGGFFFRTIDTSFTNFTDTISGTEENRTTFYTETDNDGKTTYTYTSIHPRFNGQTDLSCSFTISSEHFDTNNLTLDFTVTTNTGENPTYTTNFSNPFPEILKVTVVSAETSFTVKQNKTFTIIDNGNTFTNDNGNIHRTENKETLVKSILKISFYKTFTEQDYHLQFASSDNTKFWEKLEVKGENDYSYDLSENNPVTSGGINTQGVFEGSLSEFLLIDAKAESPIVNCDTISISSHNSSQEGYRLLVQQLNTELSNNTLTNGSYFSISESNFVKLNININKIYNTSDYKLVFYDSTSFATCSATNDKTQNATVDTTLGYILGFRKFSEYDLNINSVDEVIKSLIEPPVANSPNKIKITSDSVLYISLYNTLMIILEDYNQGHINDTLVTITKHNTQAKVPNRRQYAQNPLTAFPTAITDKQLQSIQTQVTEPETATYTGTQTTALKDVFAIVPIKFGLKSGDVFVEFGGTLQAQERSFFGPVNINRFRVKLVTDKGNVLNLNGADWQFQVIVEQLYKRTDST